MGIIRLSDATMKAIKSVMMVLLTLHFAQGCADCLNTNEVRTLLNKRLKVGDTRQEIEAVLKDIGFSWTYTDFLKRYNTTLRDEKRCGAYQAISVYIKLDESERLKEIEVFGSYTMP